MKSSISPSQYPFLFACLSAFLLPLKLSLVYVVLLPLLLWWIISSRGNLETVVGGSQQTIAPLLIFIASAALSSLFGIAPLHSLLSLSTLLFFCTFLCLVCRITHDGSHRILLGALILGQSLAALHSFIEELYGQRLSLELLGEMTESGQLELVLPTSFAFLLSLSRIQGGPTASQTKLAIIIGSVHLVLFTILSFFEVQLGTSFFGLLLAALTVSIALQAGRMVKMVRSQQHLHALSVALCTICIPLMTVALFINLKRGPWAGVLVGTIVFLASIRKRILLPVVILCVGALVLIEPVRTRLVQSQEHFFISGGRSLIWDIGTELAEIYPLGIGYKNSAFLQQFSPQIPQQLKHFHNNLLNILVETGWLSLGIFIWWIIALVRGAFGIRADSERRMLGRGLGCAIISWQVAGIVEYNFGDSEVFLVAFLLLGILAQLTAHEVRVAQEQRVPVASENERMMTLDSERPGILPQATQN